MNTTLTTPTTSMISPQDSGSATHFDYDYIIPVVDPSSLDLRCGRNASTAWSRPKTAVVRAGDAVGFAVNTTVGLPIAGAPVMPWDVRFIPLIQSLPISRSVGQGGLADFDQNV